MRFFQVAFVTGELSQLSKLPATSIASLDDASNRLQEIRSRAKSDQVDKAATASAYNTAVGKLSMISAASSLLRLRMRANPKDFGLETWKLEEAGNQKQSLKKQIDVLGEKVIPEAADARDRIGILIGVVQHPDFEERMAGSEFSEEYFYEIVGLTQILCSLGEEAGELATALARS